MRYETLNNITPTLWHFSSISNICLRVRELNAFHKSKMNRIWNKFGRNSKQAMLLVENNVFGERKKSARKASKKCSIESVSRVHRAIELFKKFARRQKGDFFVYTWNTEKLRCFQYGFIKANFLTSFHEFTNIVEISRNQTIHIA